MATIKKDGKYGILIGAKRDLTKDESDYVQKTLDLAASSIKLHLKDNAVSVTPNKNGDH